MPGTLIVEALAQAGSLLILKSAAFEGKLPTLAVSTMQNFQNLFDQETRYF